MTSSLTSIYTSQTGLTANQAALNIVSNNLANMNNDDYSKQTVDMTESSSGGVDIEGITRSSNSYLNAYYRSENADLSYYEKLSTMAAYVEDITNELDADSGLTNALDEFYEAAQKLTQDPTDLTARTNYIEKASAVAETFNSISDQLTDLRESLVGDSNDPTSLENTTIDLYVDDVNDKLKQLAELNEDIALASNGDGDPNNLLDKRDAILDELSEYISIEVKEGINNSITVSCDGVQLVSGTTVKASFSVSSNTEDDPALVSIVNAATGNVKIADYTDLDSTGSIAAILEITGSDSDASIGSILNKLNTLASEFSGALNDIQLYDDGTNAAMCIDNSGSTSTLTPSTEALYETSDGSATITAANITINENIEGDPSLIATARTEYDAAGDSTTPNAVGDTDNILKVAGLRDNNISGLGNATTEDFLTSLTGNIGVEIEGIKTNYESQESVVDEIKTNQSSETGVNMDEELVDLVKFQRAYQASSRVFTIQNEILEMIISMGA